jgi:hypothetical protein
VVWKENAVFTLQQTGSTLSTDSATICAAVEKGTAKAHHAELTKHMQEQCKPDHDCPHSAAGADWVQQSVFNHTLD